MILEKARNQQVYITLLGPKNETLTGQLNMTDFQSLSRTGQRESVALKDTSATAPKYYDSRGAAYYICVFILVYALAIVMFVASLARRRRSDQNGDFSRLPKCDILHYYNAEIASSIRETTAAERYSFAKDNDSAPRHTTSAVCSEKPATARTNRSVDSTRRKEIGLHKIDGCSIPDELITLVQVLPCIGAESNPEAYWADGSGSDDARRHSSAYEQKCRWSIGPDGNLYILQVDQNDSCTNFCLEESHDQSLLQSIVTAKQDLNYATDKPEKDGLSNRSKSDTNGATVNSAEYDNNTSVSDCRQQTVVSCPPEKYSTMDSSSKKPPEETTTFTKCESMSFAEQDCLITDNNYNCDFENPWGLPTCPEIQKLIHVTSV